MVGHGIEATDPPSPALRKFCVSLRYRPMFNGLRIGVASDTPFIYMACRWKAR